MRCCVTVDDVRCCFRLLLLRDSDIAGRARALLPQVSKGAAVIHLTACNPESATDNDGVADISECTLQRTSAVS